MLVATVLSAAGLPGCASPHGAKPATTTATAATPRQATTTSAGVLPITSFDKQFAAFCRPEASYVAIAGVPPKTIRAAKTGLATILTDLTAMRKAAPPAIRSDAGNLYTELYPIFSKELQYFGTLPPESPPPTSVPAQLKQLAGQVSSAKINQDNVAIKSWSKAHCSKGP